MQQGKQKWAVITGTRPEAIKLAPVVAAMAAQPGLQPCLIATGQHRELLDGALADFGLPPDYRLDVMREGQSLNRLSARLLDGLAPVMERERPDAVLVQGDTTSAMVGALAAFHSNIHVYHVEAGLRSHRLDAPFPEEANRQLIGRLARLHFAPTHHAAANLVTEGIDPARIHTTGNTVVDALHSMVGRLAQDDRIATATLGNALPLVLSGRPVILATAHRRESFGEGIARLCHALAGIAAAFPEAVIVFPVHPNPQVRGPVHALLGAVPSMHLLPPLSYAACVWLMQRCQFVITDSGGIQEEAASLGKPVIVTRDVTERVEAVAAESAMLTGTDAASIHAHAAKLLTDPLFYAQRRPRPGLYGDGNAAMRIVAAIQADRQGAPMAVVI